VFRRPRFLPDGTLNRPATLTVFHNGIVVQDHAELLGPTMWLQHLPYAPHPDRLPLSIQHHGDPVRFRNIWVRALREHAEPGPAERDTTPVLWLAEEALDRYVGLYKYRPDSETGFEIVRNGRQLSCIFGKERAKVDLVPHSETRFSMRWTAAHVDFELDEKGRAVSMTLNVGGGGFTVKRME